MNRTLVFVITPILLLAGAFIALRAKAISDGDRHCSGGLSADRRFSVDIVGVSIGTTHGLSFRMAALENGTPTNRALFWWHLWPWSQIESTYEAEGYIRD